MERGQKTKSSVRGAPQEKVFEENLQSSWENTYARASFLIELQVSACNFIEWETMAQVFCHEFCEISKNIFFTEYLWATVSDFWIPTNKLSVK